MDHLVIGALEEGRVDGAERAMALRGEPGGEGHAMLFGDADVEGAVGNSFSNLSSPVPDGIAAVIATTLSSRRASAAERIGEHRGIGRRAAARPLVLLARDDVELDHAMIFVGGVLGRAIALALDRDGMDQDRAFVGVADILEDFDQRLDIMAVDRTDVIKAQFLEQGAAGHQAAGIFLDLARGAVDRLGHGPGELLRHPPRARDICPN